MQMGYWVGIGYESGIQIWTININLHVIKITWLFKVIELDDRWAQQGGECKQKV